MSNDNFTHNIKRTSICAANCANGRHCKRKTCLSQYCWMHLKTQNGLVVKKSTIPNSGLGLFSSWDRKPKDFVAVYKGVSSSNPVRGDYVVYNRSARRYIDAKYSNSCAARFANDSRGNRNNCKFADSRHGVNLRTTKTIKKGQELFVPYGRSYWR